MIETVGDLLKLLHRYPSSTRLWIGLSDEEVVSLVDVINGDTDVILLMADIPTIEEKPKRQTAPSSDVDDALEQCDRILEMCDEVPAKGEDFADSVREKVESIAAWIEENKHITDAQKQSLDNMENGVSRWVNH